MSDKVMITESTLDDIADAIREKNGEEFKYYPNEMPAAVRRIQTGGGGSGSVVAVFPVLLSGEHIADIVVDGDTFALYAPEPIEYQEGTGITIDNGVVSLSDAVQTTLAGKVDTSTFTTAIANLVASVASKQDILTAGQGITITGTTISADGTDVEANPSEEPTEELNSIKIGDTVYEIIGGGGGSYSEEIIYTGTNSSSTPITLTKNINEFDLIQFVVSYTDHNTTSTYEIPVKYFVDNYPYSQFSSLATPNLTIALAGNEWFRIARGQTDTQLQFMKGNNFYLKSVIGIKTGGSGGGGTEIDLVPRLTSNIAQGIGEASDNDPLSSVWLPWHAFATDTEFDASVNGGYWATNSADGYIQFEFEKTATITKIAFGVYTSCSFRVQYSLDGTNFTDGDILSRTGPATGYICHNETTTLSAPIKCTVIRLKAVVAGNSNLGAVHFYGNWDESGGASAVSDLTDVDLTNLADGQVLKWNATTQKWENANESGGTTLPFDVVINSTDNGIDIVYDDGT